MQNNNTNSILNELKGRHSIPNFIVLLFISSLLIIDFIPYFKAAEIIHPQFLYLSVLNTIIGVYFYCNSQLVFPDIVSSLKKSLVFKLYAAFLFFCAISYFAAKNTSLVFTKFTDIAIIFCLFINISILLKNKLDLIYKIIFIVSISALIQSWQQLCHFVIIPRHASIMALLNEMKGNTGNINILAASLTIKVPFLLLGITYFKTYKKWFLVFILFSVTSVIFLTGARTPMINLFLIYSIYIIYLLKEYSSKRTAISKVIHLVIPVLIAILFANTIFQKSKDKGRYKSLENRVTQINTNDASSQLRLAFWGNALKITKSTPLSGIGLGNYQVESIPYEKTIADDSLASIHAHNDFLEILSETGIINGLIFLSIFLSVFFINLKRILKAQKKETKITALLTLLILIVYGIDSVFNFPMYRPTMSIFFSLIIALTLTNNFKSDSDTSKNNTASLKAIILILIGITSMLSYSAFRIYKVSNLQYLIVTDKFYTDDKKVLTGDKIAEKMSLYPNVTSSSEPYSQYAAIYYIREKNYDKAQKYLSKANKINNYDGSIDYYKHLIAKEKGNLDSAYIYIKRAFYTRPRNYQIFTNSILMAITRKDTLEILKQNKLFTQYRSMPKVSEITLKGLKHSGYNYNNLLKFIDEGLKKNPQDSALLEQKNQILITNYLIGGQEFEKSDFKKALETYEKALKIDPKNVYISQNIGFNYLKQGKNKKAISTLLKTLKSPDLNDGKTEFYLGILYLKENDKANALKYFNLSKDKNYPLAKQLMSKIENNGFTYEKELKKRKNDLLIADLITEGQNFEDEKKMDKALESYEKALKIDPKSIYAAQNIGFYYLKIGQTKKAINYLLNALKYPGLNDGKTEYFLAVCYLKEDDKTNACKYLNISKNKNYSNAQQLLKICK